MPQHSSATDVLGVGTLVLVAFFCCVGVLSLAFVLSFHIRLSKVRQPLLHEFDSPWLVRMVLVCFFILWNLGELLRIPWLREGDRLLHNLGSSSQANLCRLHVVWSVGLMEPGLFLTVLFLVQASLQAATKHMNGRILMFMCLSVLPVFILQTVLATTDEKLRAAFGAKFPSYYTASYKVLHNEDPKTMLTMCSYPLLGILSLALFFIIFVPYFSCLGYRVVCHIINRKLQVRMYWLVLAMILLLPLHVAFLGVSARINPEDTAHQVLAFLSFITLLLCAMAAIGVLVLLPVADASAVHRFFKCRHWSQTQTVETEAFRGSLYVTSDDEVPSHRMVRRSLLKAVSHVQTDVKPSDGDSSLSFETMSRDSTLRPGTWLGDVPGSVISPALSPSRKPLILI